MRGSLFSAFFFLMGLYSHLAAQDSSPWLFTVRGDTLHQAFVLDTGLFTTQIKLGKDDYLSLGQVQAAFDGKNYYERIPLGSGLFSTSRLLPRIKTGDYDLFDGGTSSSVVSTNGGMVTPGTTPNGIQTTSVSSHSYYYRFPGQKPVFVDINGVRAGFGSKAPYADMFATADQQSTRKWLFWAGALGSSAILYATMGGDAFNGPAIVLPLGCMATGAVYWLMQSHTESKIVDSFLSF